MNSLLLSNPAILNLAIKTIKNEMLEYNSSSDFESFCTSLCNDTFAVHDSNCHAVIEKCGALNCVFLLQDYRFKWDENLRIKDVFDLVNDLFSFVLSDIFKHITVSLWLNGTEPLTELNKTRIVEVLNAIKTS